MVLRHAPATGGLCCCRCCERSGRTIANWRRSSCGHGSVYASRSLAGQAEPPAACGSFLPERPRCGTLSRLRRADSTLRGVSRRNMDSTCASATKQASARWPRSPCCSLANARRPRSRGSPQPGVRGATDEARDQSKEYEVEALGAIRLDTFIVTSRTRQPGGGHWESATYTQNEWNRAFGAAAIIR